MEDEAVLSAIACHTAGKPGMSKLDKILYLADMDAAMLMALKQTNDFVLSQESRWTPCQRRPTTTFRRRWRPAPQSLKIRPAHRK